MAQALSKVQMKPEGLKRGSGKRRADADCLAGEWTGKKRKRKGEVLAASAVERDEGVGVVEVKLEGEEGEVAFPAAGNERAKSASVPAGQKEQRAQVKGPS